MKLEKGKKYWCGWASRYAVYVGLRNGKHIFKDVIGAYIDCEPEYISKWVKEKAGI